MRKKERQSWCFALAMCVGGAILSLCLGAAELSLLALWRAICDGPHNTAGYIFWYSRLPRTCACLFSGAALAVSGCILQNILGNRLASPSIIGVNAGAGLAVTVCCACSFLSGWAISLAAFGGALAAVFLVMILAQKTGASRATVILSGVAINCILNALRDGVSTLVPDAGVLGSDFRVGGFSALAINRLAPAVVLIFVALLFAFTLHHELDILNLGEDTAQSLGLPVRKMRSVFLILAAVLAGAAVSFAGLLSFVGLLVPHTVRQAVGSGGKAYLPLCALSGAALVTICDLFSRLLFAPFELPVGILISVIGAPFFLLLLLKGKGGHRSA